MSSSGTFKFNSTSKMRADVLLKVDKRTTLPSICGDNHSVCHYVAFLEVIQLLYYNITVLNRSRFYSFSGGRAMCALRSGSCHENWTWTFQRSTHLVSLSAWSCWIVGVDQKHSAHAALGRKRKKPIRIPLHNREIQRAKLSIP